MASPDPRWTLNPNRAPDARRYALRHGGGWRRSETAPRTRKETAMEDDSPQAYALELALIALVSAVEARLPGTRAAVKADLTHQARQEEAPVAEALHLLVERIG